MFRVTLLSNVWSAHYLLMFGVYIYIFAHYLPLWFSTSWTQASKSNITSSGMSIKSRDIPWDIEFHYFKVWGHFYLVSMLGWCGWDSLIMLLGWITGMGCGGGQLGGVASLGISCMKRYSWLSSTGFLDHIGLPKSVVRKSSLPLESSSVGEGVSLKVG